MKKILIVASLIFLICSCTTNSVYRSEMPPSERTRYYDEKGRYQGYSIKSNTGVTRYYDSKGRYKGKSE